MRVKVPNTTVWMATVLAVGLIVTAFAVVRQSSENDRIARAAVQSAAERVATDVTDRINLYQYGIHGVRGVVLTAGTNAITNEVFARYARSRDLDTDFPGARGFGFIRRVPVDQEQSFLDAMRKDGRPDFHITQLTKHDRERWVIQFIEPVETNAAAVGLDAASESNRREAAELAMRSGATAATAPIVVVQDPDPTQKWLLLMMPIYTPGVPTATREQRERALEGWAYAVLAMRDIMSHLRVDHTLHLVLRDVTRPHDEQVIYETRHDDPVRLLYPQKLDRTVFGRAWVIEVSAYPAFVQALNLTQPSAVALMGTLASLLLAALAGAASANRRRKQLIAMRLADFNARLEQQVVERTEELTHAKAAAESANAAKGRFLAIMSHELRTPMSGVLGMGELLMASELQPEQQRMMHTLMGSARTLLDLLNDILDFAKIEAGRVDLEEIDFSVRHIINDVQSVLAPLASEKGNTIETIVDATLGPAQRGDAKRYRQILMNLVGNANKFTTKGKITITVCAPHPGDDPFMVETTVTDTGVGIASDNRDRLFQPFVQEDTSTSRTYGGTGLGLAISKTLAELMGGKIWLESTLGVGSAFSFSVLLRHGDADKAAKTAEGMRPGFSGIKPAAQSLRILLAEDNDTNRMLALRVLSKMGHAVKAVVNGAEAVDEMHRQAFDVVLMDMQMPVMDGPTAMRIIRAAEHPGKRIPIIALTADALRDHHRDYLDAGADTILTKPVDWAWLGLEMERLVRGEQAPVAVRDAIAPSQPSALLNTELLDAMFAELGADLTPLLDAMAQESMRMMNDLAQGSETGEILRRKAHALKGLTAQFGAQRVADIAARLEKAAKEGAPVEVLLSELEIEAKEALIALKAWRAQTPLDTLC
jgi:signal transduction histidine kinase/DNA-binding NarL/FixJ family response regulator